ncbi:hypothetical protein KKG58_01660 [Patescibacteria group bacterium]|nr:hypothetical protein [Patescibacteria group bacterium]
MKKFFIVLKALFLALVKDSTGDQDLAENDMDNMPKLLILALLIMFLAFISGGAIKQGNWGMIILLGIFTAIWVAWYVFEFIAHYKELLNR